MTTPHPTRVRQSSESGEASKRTPEGGLVPPPTPKIWLLPATETRSCCVHDLVSVARERFSVGVQVVPPGPLRRPAEHPLGLLAGDTPVSYTHLTLPTNREV